MDEHKYRCVTPGHGKYACPKCGACLGEHGAIVLSTCRKCDESIINDKDHGKTVTWAEFLSGAKQEYMKR